MSASVGRAPKRDVATAASVSATNGSRKGDASPKVKRVKSEDKLGGRVPAMNEPVSKSGTGFQMARLALVEALQAKSKISSRNYDFVREQLQPQSPVRFQWLAALSTCVSMLNERNHHELLELAVACDFTVSDANFHVYEEFVSNLVSANTHHLPLVFQSVVRQLLPTGKDDNISVPSEGVCTRALDLLLTIMGLVPIAHTALEPVLVELFPHRRKDVTFQRVFLANLLRLATMAPVLRDHIVGLAVDRMIQIDVEIKLDLFDDEGDDDDEAGGAAADDMFDMEENLTAARRREREESVRLSEKLDAMMQLMFEYLQQESQDEERRESVFLLMMRIFDTSIVRTHQSKYTQFLIFYLCSLDVRYQGALVEYLTHCTTTPSTDTGLRIASAAYAASFVARARYITEETAQMVINPLVVWVHAYIERHAREVLTTADMGNHVLFYVVCQAIFYVFCFLEDMLLGSEDGVSYVQKLGLNRIVQSQFNPLRVCLQTIVTEFARIAYDHQIVYCHDIIHANQRSLSLTIAATSGKVGGSTPGNSELAQQRWLNDLGQIDAFFPFDPYTLKQSEPFVVELYREWVSKDAEGEDDEDDDDDEDGAAARGEADEAAPEDAEAVGASGSSSSASDDEVDEVQDEDAGVAHSEHDDSSVAASIVLSPVAVPLSERRARKRGPSPVVGSANSQLAVSLTASHQGARKRMRNAPAEPLTPNSPDADEHLQPFASFHRGAARGFGRGGMDSPPKWAPMTWEPGRGRPEMSDRIQMSF